MNHRGTETRRTELPDGINEISGAIVDAAFAVHSELGPGLLESIYEQCLLIELMNRDLQVDRQIAVPVVYKDRKLDAGFRVDLLVEKSIIIELKAVDSVLPIHTAQLLTYLKLTNKRLGHLINFNVTRIKYGIHRVIL